MDMFKAFQELKFGEERAARRSPDHGAAPAATLLLMADDYTAWNRRKRTTGASVKDALRELNFCAVCALLLVKETPPRPQTARPML